MSYRNDKTCDYSREYDIMPCCVCCFQAPDPPVSYYHGDGTPSLALAGPTSLRVTYGAPQFDGGDRITAFKVLAPSSLLALRSAQSEEYN